MLIAQPYLVAKFLHIIGIISWMAGILYLYRLLVYHFDHQEPTDPSFSLLSVMEFRLYRYITMPAMGVSILAGVWIIFLYPTLLYQRWFQVKLACGILMIISTLYAKRIMKRFQSQQVQNFTSRSLRILNEVPTLLMLIIVAMVVFRFT